MLAANWKEFEEKVFKMVEDLACNEYDIVRLNSVENLNIMGKSYSQKVNKIVKFQEKSERIYPIICRLMKDPSWRVRFSVCSHMEEVSKA